MKKLRLGDDEHESELSPEQQPPTDIKKNAAKRYFSQMIDDYPDTFISFIVKREKAKLARIDADRLQKESDEEMKNCLTLYDNEPLYDIQDLLEE